MKDVTDVERQEEKLPESSSIPTQRLEEDHEDEAGSMDQVQQKKKKENDDNNNNNQITPHMERLLRLIEQGSGDMVDAAVDQLYHLCCSSSSSSSSCSSGPSSETISTTCTRMNQTIVLWRILGRLQATLCGFRNSNNSNSNSWKARIQTAIALERMAQLIPRADQEAFWKQRQAQQEENSSQQTLGKEEMGDYLTLSQVSQPLVWFQWMRQGRPLYVTAASQWEQEQMDQELQTLQELTTEAAACEESLTANDDPVTNRKSAVQRRMAWQRRQLAQRLGLQALLVTQQDTDYLVDADEDDETSTRPKKKPRKDEKETQTITEPFSNREGNNHNAPTMEHLLVVELQRSRRIGQPHENDQTTTTTSQLSPQCLLATEFLYRMFDPSWQVRHGALLGLLSCVRAWQTSLVDMMQEENDQDSGLLWPQDLLVRAMALLALDRFGDFSGAFLTSEEDENSHEKSSFYQGGVVAPIRETAGQLVALLFTLFPSDQQTRILDILEHCLLATSAFKGDSNKRQDGLSNETENIWETRHGALVTLKYTAALVWRKAEQTRALSEHSALLGAMSSSGSKSAVSTRELSELLTRAQSLMLRVSRISVAHLIDPSDDVVCVAAQTLREIIKSHRSSASSSSSSPNNDGSNNILDSYLEEARVMSVLYKALRKAPSFSSCIPDLVALLSELLEYKISFVQELTSSHSISDLFDLLSSLLVSDYESVQISALSSLGSMLVVMGTLWNSKTMDEVSTYSSSCIQIFLRLLQFKMDGALNAESQSALVNTQLEKTWSQLCTVFGSSVFESDHETFSRLEKELYVFFFCHKVMQSSSSRYQDFDVMAGMLVKFSKSLETNFPSQFLKFVLGAMLHSPWVTQCETACVALRFFSQEMPPPLNLISELQSVVNESFCISIRETPDSAEKLLDAGTIQLCNEAMLRGAEMVLDGQCVEGAIDCVTTIWAETFRGKDDQPNNGQNRAATNDVLQMRLRASASIAVVRYNLPAKLTPFVRCLMSSLKSETSEHRLRRTTEGITFLLMSISNIPSHASAYFKILRSLCDAAIKESRGIKQLKYHAASEGVRKVVRGIPTKQLEDRAFPIWIWLAAFDHKNSDEQLLSATHLIQLLCYESTSTSHVSSFFASAFVGELVALSLKHENSEVQSASISAIQSICSSKATEILRMTLETLVEGVDASCSSGSQRLRGCKLLGRIVAETGPAFKPFIRSLFPVVMKLMRDQNVECSAEATHIFSSFVQLAPLVRLDESLSVCSSSEDEHTSTVIDHLILGLPIPPCHLPENVIVAFGKTRISLRAYQEEGISWLNLLQSMHLNGALCDDMGLGKTVQALVSIAESHSKEKGLPQRISLVVCPLTLVGHWMSEIEQFFGSDSAVFCPVALSGPASSRRKQWNSLPQECNLVVTSYSVLRSDIEQLERINWTYCVLDEGHLLKNPKTATSRASRRIKALHKLVLSGTIIQNRVHDLWAVFDFLMPNFLGTSRDFWAQYGNPITKSHSSNATAQDIHEGMQKLKSLHQKVLPFILRREKEQVLKDLPPKNIMVLRCDMSEAQAAIYSSFIASAEMKKSISALQQAIESQQEKNKGSSIGSDVFRSLLFLRLLCTHPSLVATKSNPVSTTERPILSDSGKLLALADLLRHIGIREDIQSGADNDTSLLYCENNESDEEQDDAFGSITTSSFAPISLRSTDASEDSPKCLIFAQFSQSLDLVEQTVLGRLMPSVKYLRLDGTVASSQRVSVAQQFNSDPSVKLLLLTTRVGSLGLNLTGAAAVIFLEHDWNPFVDLQAMDRAHRIGQTKTVNVYRLVMRQTVEEKIMDLQRKKTAMSEAVVNTENSSLYSLGTDRLLDILTVENPKHCKEGQSMTGFDLDSLLERYGDDYNASLSTSRFVNTNI